MPAVIKNVLIVIAALIIALVIFIFVIGTTGRDGAFAMAVDSVIGQINANVAKVTGIQQLIPTINSSADATSATGQTDSNYNQVQSGGGSGASGGVWD